MDRSQIGNERQQNDNRIAVSSARLLRDCWRELAESLRAHELGEHEHVPEQMKSYRALCSDSDDLDANAWVKACVMADKATALLTGAVASGRLTVWRIHKADEKALAPIMLGHDNVKHGIINSFERPEPDDQGALLWVKNADWKVYLNAIASESYGGVSHLKVKIGLPSNEAIIEKMHELAAAGMPRDEAAKHIRTVPGFELVGNELARRLVSGTLPKGRPKRVKKTRQQNRQDKALTLLLLRFAVWGTRQSIH